MADCVTAAAASLGPYDCVVLSGLWVTAAAAAASLGPYDCVLCSGLWPTA